MMKAVGYRKPLPVSDAESLMDMETPTPSVVGRDLLVKVEAISVNPVDVKVRSHAALDSDTFSITGIEIVDTAVMLMATAQ
jgi:NADPH:quinone reductase-like Zn-dependent oxidoreductase